MTHFLVTHFLMYWGGWFWFKKFAGGSNGKYPSFCPQIPQTNWRLGGQKRAQGRELQMAANWSGRNE